MLITINGPYKKYNQEIASKVTKEVQELYPDIKTFLYDKTPTSELDYLTCRSPKYNHYLHIARILSQMAMDIQSEEGENKPLDGYIRDYINRDDMLVIATEWYSSAILRVLSHIIQHQQFQAINIADPTVTKINIVDFAFKLVEGFQFFPPDLNIVFIPNEKDVHDSISHQVQCTKTLTKSQAIMIKECFINYNKCYQNNSFKIFNRNGEYYDPVYVFNRSNIVIPRNVAKKTSDEPLAKRYQAFDNEMLKKESASTRFYIEVVEDITDIIKTYIDILHPVTKT